MPATKRRWKDTQGVAHETWAVSFYDNKDNRHRKAGFRTKRDAEFWETDERLRLAKVDQTPKQTGNALTIAMLCQTWLDALARGHGERQAVEHLSWKDYETSVRLHITPRIGSQPISTFFAPGVSAFRSALLIGTSRTKAQRVLKHLRQALNFAVEAGYIPVNPALAIRIAPDHREKSRPDIPSRTDMQEIVAEVIRLADTKPKMWTRFATLVIILQGSGLRISEARGLTWDAVDMNEGVITVSRRLDNANQMGRVKSNASRRLVIIDSMQIEWLKRWQPLCPAGELGLVFPNGQGNGESYHNFYHRFWKPVCVTLGLVTATGTPRYSFHDTRHYRVSELIASGANIREVMGEIGHASSALTLDRYSHLFPEDLAKKRERSERIAKNLVT